MESNPRLEVKFKLTARNLPESVALQTDYFRTLTLLGRAFQSEADGHATHKRLLVYLERKGTLVYMAPVSERQAVTGKQVPAVLLVGSTGKCQTCRVCKACNQIRSTGQCGHTKKVCICPFPRRCVPWGKAEYEQDLDAIDRMQRRLAMLHANGKLTLERHHSRYQWCERMKRACKAKLFVIRQVLSERDGTLDSKRGIVGKDVVL